MLRREFNGGVLKTQLAANISNTANSFSVIDGSTFPNGGSGNPFVIVIGKGTAGEEKVLCSSRTTDTFTVQQRGYDGTTASSHSSGDLVDHVLDATTVQYMNTATNDNAIISLMGI